MTKKDRAALIAALNTGLMLYVPSENREPLAKFIAERLSVDFQKHFVEACLRP